MHALYITGDENNSTIFNGETYQQFPYITAGMTVANSVGASSIPVFFENSYTVSIMAKSYYDNHEILSPDYMVMHTGNSGTNIPF